MRIWTVEKKDSMGYEILYFHNLENARKQFDGWRKSGEMDDFTKEMYTLDVHIDEFLGIEVPTQHGFLGWIDTKD